MPHVSKTYSPKEIEVHISEIADGIYRITGFTDTLELPITSF